jgi:septal ring factor EnvC (AmiA/AmiB activator)
MLAAIRAALALGAILPDLREETDVLAEDLGALVRVKLATASEREKLALDQDSLNRDREDLAVLIDARQKELIGTESKIIEEIGKSKALAAKAQNLKELLGRLEKELDTFSKVADEAKKAAARTDMEARIANDPAAREARSRFAALAFKDPARMSPKVSFNELKGLLPHPVSGTMVKGFNVPDSLGNPSKGISVATRPGTIVSAPCDGWIAFSGPFRSYGQLLIINAGGGYYVLLAGMERANVTLGQFVLAGEPLAVMGGLPKGGIESGLAGTDKPEPVLYIEFRKDGTSIDPAPWWVSGSNEKVRG